jgi:hypothetical protein
MWLYILLTLAGQVITLVGVLGVLGSRLDEKHTSSASVQVAAAPAAVWATINDMEDFPSWIPGFTKMERLPDENGKLVWRQRMGRNSFVTNNDVFEPPDAQGRPRVLRTIKDDHGPFSGSWDHVVEPAPSGGGSVLTVTETGIIKSAIPRAIMRYVIGEDFYLKKFLSAVKKKMG